MFGDGWPDTERENDMRRIAGSVLRVVGHLTASIAVAHPATVPGKPVQVNGRVFRKGSNAVLLVNSVTASSAKIR